MNKNDLATLAFMLKILREIIFDEVKIKREIAFLQLKLEKESDISAQQKIDFYHEIIYTLRIRIEAVEKRLTFLKEQTILFKNKLENKPENKTPTKNLNEILHDY